MNTSKIYVNDLTIEVASGGNTTDRGYVVKDGSYIIRAVDVVGYHDDIGEELIKEYLIGYSSGSYDNGKLEVYQYTQGDDEWYWDSTQWGCECRKDNDSGEVMEECLVCAIINTEQEQCRLLTMLQDDGDSCIDCTYECKYSKWASYYDERSDI